MSEQSCVHYGYQDNAPQKECDDQVCTVDCPNFKWDMVHPRTTGPTPLKEGETITDGFVQVQPLNTPDPVTWTNAVALMEECLINGKKGFKELGAWFDGEKDLLWRTLQDLKDVDPCPPREHATVHTPFPVGDSVHPANELSELVGQLPQSVWVIGTTHGDHVWMSEGMFDTEQEAIDNCKEEEFVAQMPFGKRLPDNVRDLDIVYWPNRETKEEGMKKLEELRKTPVSDAVDELIKSNTDIVREVPMGKAKDDEPKPPKGYGELKVGMEGKLNGVPVIVRKITKKDIIMRPLNRSIRDKHGMMVSFKEGK